MITSLTDLLVYAPAILIIIGAFLGIRRQNHWSPWITVFGGILVILSWVIKVRVWHGDVMTDWPDMTADTQIKWLGISSTVFLAGWCIVAIGYLLEAIFRNKKKKITEQGH